MSGPAGCPRISDGEVGTAGSAGERTGLKTIKLLEEQLRNSSPGARVLRSVSG